MTQQVVAPKTAELEALFKKYPDVPREVIVKEDMLREGARFTQAVVDAGKGAILKTYQLFSWDRSSIGDMEDQKAPVKLPDTIDVRGGPYSLRRMRMRPRIRMDSPYLVDVVDGQMTVLANNEVVGTVDPFLPEPQYFRKTFEDGEAYWQVVPRECHIILFRQCQYWGPKSECKFCDINENARTKLRLGQVSNLSVKDPERVAIVVEEMLKREPWWPGDRPVEIHLNGGTVTTDILSLDEPSFYLRYVDAIKARVGNRLPVWLQTHPWTDEWEREGYRRGVNYRSCNFEVWDRRLFEWICPGKASLIGHDEWMRRIVDSVDVYGEGAILPGFVAGVEMAKPYGFQTVEEAVKSTTEGLEYLMRHGAVPRPISWCVEALSEFGKQQQETPPIDYFIQLDRNWFELWDKYQLPNAGRYRVGPGLNLYPNSAAFDMGIG